MRLERATGSRCDDADALTAELRNCGDKIFVNIELAVDVDLGADELARLNLHFPTDRARAALAYCQSHLLDGDAVRSRLLGNYFGDRFFQIRLRD